MTTAGALIQMTAHRGGAALARWLPETLRCIQVNHAYGGRSMNRWPAAVMISANSRSGPFIHFFREPFFQVRGRRQGKRVEAGFEWL